MRKTIAEKAFDYLVKNNISGVMQGDEHLLHDIADECGIPHRGHTTSIQVLNAIDRNHKKWFDKSFVRVHVGEHCRETYVRCFDVKKS